LDNRFAIDHIVHSLCDDILILSSQRRSPQTALPLQKRPSL